MESFRTIPELLFDPAVQHVNNRAVNDRIGSAWRAVSTSELIRRVAWLAVSLHERLPAPGACVGVLSAPSAAWLTADLATMLAGGVTVPFFVDFSESHFSYKVEDSGMKTIFVFGAGPWKRFLPFAERFDLIVTDQPTDIPTALHIDKLYASGEALLEQYPERLTHLLDLLDPASLAVIIYTSGSTGNPKGVELTHYNLAAQLNDIIPLFPIRPGEDRALSLLPVAHSFERMVLYLYLSQGMCIYFVDDVNQLGALMREVRPTMMTVVPRLLEKTYDHVRNKAASLPGLKGRFARWTVERASRLHNEAEAFRPCTWLADRLVGWQVAKAMGGKLHTVVAGGAHMPDELNHFFVRVGLPVYEGYGMTEAAPIICSNYPGKRKIGTVGIPLKSVEIATTEEGEVLARGPNIMRGYRRMPQETARVIDDAGWLHTGDLGDIDGEGFLTIKARRKEMFKTSTGETVFPGPLEQALCRPELVDAACVIAEGRKHVSCLLFVNSDALERVGDGGGEAIASPAVEQAVQVLIREVNAGLDHWEQIHAYALLRDPPSVANEELTPTLKLRRHILEDHYREVIDQLYDETRQMEDRYEYAIGHC
jgi:long-chain acyl-CoA synthetase